jgi:gentisate 1,2-dioxygenase
VSSPDRESQREAFYARIDRFHLAPLWTRLKALVPREPSPGAVACRWRYGDVRPHLLESAQHISASEAERRVLILENPALRGASQVTGSLYAGLQIIMPGELAPTHRHTQSALRFILEGSGAYTTVDGEKVSMEPGDLVLTPAWRWHLHGNDTTSPMVWLDGLDIPLVMYLGGTFREDAAAGAPVGEGAPAGEEPTAEQAAAPIHFPYAEARAALDAQASGPGDPHAGHVHRYVDPKTGSWPTPTMAMAIRLVAKGTTTRPYRATDGAVFVAIEGKGRIQVAGSDFDLSPRDIIAVPGWTPYAIHAADDLVLFSFSDRAAQEKLGLFREERL